MPQSIKTEENIEEVDESGEWNKSDADNDSEEEGEFREDGSSSSSDSDEENNSDEEQELTEDDSSSSSDSEESNDSEDESAEEEESEKEDSSCSSDSEVEDESEEENDSEESEEEESEEEESEEEESEEEQSSFSSESEEEDESEDVGESEEENSSSSSGSEDEVTHRRDHPSLGCVAVSQSKAKNAKVSGAALSSSSGPTQQSQPAKDFHKELQCPICLETLCSATTLGCGHTFCACCLQEVRDRNRAKCPLCRAPINSVTRCVALDNVIKSLAKE